MNHKRGKIEEEIKELIDNNGDLSHHQLAQLINKEKGTNMSSEAIRKRRNRLGKSRKILRLSPAQQVEVDIKTSTIEREQEVLKKKYGLLLSKLKDTEIARDIVQHIKSVHAHTIHAPKVGNSSATAVVLASDWHSEEIIRSGSVNGLNEFNPEIADKRIQMFFASVVRLIKVKQKSITVEELILALLGDFITGNIHEEIETACAPAEALRIVQNHIASGIEHILANTNVNIVLPCHSGNHGRSTHTVHQGTEHENSWEYLMYHNLADHFRGNKRVKFMVAQGYHSFVDVNGFKIRFHHGHNVKFSGGVGGLAIPIRKSISQWNKACNVDLDCMGHFHQLIWYSNFVENGSLIGFNAFAVAIKADYEKPRQAFFLVNHQRKEVTDFCPVWLE